MNLCPGRIGTTGILSLGILFSAQVFGASVAHYQGDFKITPPVMHDDAIQGTMTLFYDGGALKQVELKSDKSVFGKADFLSKEQWANEPEAVDGVPLTIAFKLTGPSHDWYFVFVGTSVDGNATLVGKFYVGGSSLSSIQKAVAAGVSQKVPSSWERVGDATLKAL